MRERWALFFGLMLLVSPLALAKESKQKQEEEPLPKVLTYILVKDMHCADCAKKIARKLFAVKGVKGVRAVMKTNTATVTPESGKQPSPLELWKAVEEAGFKPIKLVGPKGRFEERPKDPQQEQSKVGRASPPDQNGTK